MKKYLVTYMMGGQQRQDEFFGHSIIDAQNAVKQRYPGTSPGTIKEIKQ